MKKTFVVPVLAALAAASVWAQEPKVVGKFAAVKGLVTVSSGGQVFNAVNGGAFAVGNRVIATASGGVTLKFDNGCDLTLKENESVTVDENNKCALVALPTGGGAPAVVAAGGSVGPALIFGGAAVGVILAGRNNNKTSGS